MAESKSYHSLAALPAPDRIAVEDVLRALLECEYRGHEATEAHLAGLSDIGRQRTGRGLAEAGRLELVTTALAGTWTLSVAGRVEAVRIMRAHRLTETRLARETGVPAKQWHDVAHSHEHAMTEGEVDALADQLGNPRFDPHGDPIPTREGHLPEPEDHPLLEWPSGETGVIAHVEDEPKDLFAELNALGVVAGLRFVRVRGDRELELRVEGRKVTLSPELAPLVRVRALHRDENDMVPNAVRLSDLEDGGVAQVVTLLPSCAGSERSRLLDLGFVPGSRIERVLNSPLHGPVAYEVRGTLIALRRSQADHVLIKRITQEQRA
ncbi:FeoA domain-containing protein [Actomonas aquatica]|uniref:FeoA domain-containing protein n=1 Tax=Actomonas aquatica TaxID=2866162 RepID=A0ABZ1C8B6_9BACT|nr:FeoA domain-containing protein [Opitutus sp. WL0086]WRQ87941.1 FeoA domain-containing protein [Opitutus sp. WL0086]